MKPLCNKNDFSSLNNYRTLSLLFRTFSKKQLLNYFTSNSFSDQSSSENIDRACFLQLHNYIYYIAIRHKKTHFYIFIYLQKLIIQLIVTFLYLNTKLKIINNWLWAIIDASIYNVNITDNSINDAHILYIFAYFNFCFQFKIYLAHYFLVYIMIM